MKRYLWAILGCVIIGTTFNLFFLPYDLVPSGIYGFGALFNYEFNYDPFLFLIIVNVSFLLISWTSLSGEETKKYILPSILIPAVILATENIADYIVFDNLEIILVAVIGGYLMGLGYSLIFKQGFSTGGMEVLQDVFNSVKVYRRKEFMYIIEAILVILTCFTLNVESALYSVIAIILIKYMTTKSKVGISSSKTFFIITKKEAEVKHYIIKELKHDLTEFNVKGGFSNNKTKILMTSINTKDYYKLKEGINVIDPDAFISILDSYEVINKNKTLNESLEIDE